MTMAARPRRNRAARAYHRTGAYPVGPGKRDAECTVWLETTEEGHLSNPTEMLFARARRRNRDRIFEADEFNPDPSRLSQDHRFVHDLQETDPEIP